MKIDLSITITEEILALLSNMTKFSQTPPVAKFGHICTHFDVMDKFFPLDNTERRGKPFDVSHVKQREIEATDINMTEISEHDFVMFYSDHLKEKQFGTPAYVHNHPELSNTLITQLISAKVSMIGIDFASIRNAPQHSQADQYCADHGVFIIENLANLDILLAAVKDQPFGVHTYPVNDTGLTGLPYRVIAEVSSKI